MLRGLVEDEVGAAEELGVVDGEVGPVEELIGAVEDDGRPVVTTLVEPASKVCTVEVVEPTKKL